MIRRILTASILSLATAVSGLSVVAQAATAPSATTTLSDVTQTVQTTTTAQAASPTLDCGAGIVGTVCAVVLGPICKDRCAAAGTTQTNGAANTARATSAPSAATAISPKLFCAPEFQIVCDILGLTVCRKTGCPTAPAPQLAVSRAAAPSIDCAIDVLCVVIGVLCRSGCELAASSSTAATAEQPRSVQTCTVDLRPNVTCLLQQI